MLGRLRSSRLLVALCGFICVSQLWAQVPSLQAVPAELLQGTPTLRMRSGDLDLDGLQDIAAVQFDSSPANAQRVVIQRQRPTALGDPVRFETTQVLPADLPQDIALLDLDEDGDQDLLVAQDRVDQALVIWLNAGGLQQGQAGRFQRHPSNLSGELIGAVRSLRLATSGPRKDLLLVGTVGRPSRLYENLSGFGSVLLIPGQSINHPGAVGAEIGDLNGDGKDDLILYGTQTRVLLNIGSLAEPMQETASDPFAGIGTVFALSLVDLDGDQDLDVVLATGSDDRIFSNLGLDANGEPQFVLSQTLTQGPPGVSREFAWIDADGDQLADLVAARDNVNAPATLRGSPVYRNLGATLGLATTPLQLISPAATVVAGSLGAGSGAHLWLGSSDPLYNGLWRSDLASPVAPLASIGASVGPSGVNGYYYGDRIAAQVEILPAAGELTTLAVSVSGDSGPVTQSSVAMAAGEQRRRVLAQVPANPLSFERWRFQLTGVTPMGAAGIGMPDQAVIATVPNPFANDFEMQCYIACVMLAICEKPGATASAPKGSALLMGSLAEVQLLRRLRDERLAASSEGAALIDLYQSLGLDLYRASFAEPGFYSELWRLKDAWMPAVSSLVDGDGSMPISAEMQDRLDAVLLRFEQYGSEALRLAIGVQRVSLQLDRLQGRPVAEFQRRWEQGPIFADGFD